jgi:hypothetical protein
MGKAFIAQGRLFTAYYQRFSAKEQASFHDQLACCVGMVSPQPIAPRTFVHGLFIRKLLSTE